MAGRVADERGDRRRCRARSSTPWSSSSQRANASSHDDLAPRVAVADHRLAEAVGVVVQVAERRALRAEVALRPHVVAVAADQRDVLVLDVDLEAAHASHSGHVTKCRCISQLFHTTPPQPRVDCASGRHRRQTGHRAERSGHAEGGASPTKPPHDASAASEEDREEAMRSLRRAGARSVRRRGGRGRRCRPTGGAASTSPGPRSGGCAPG